MLRLNYTGMDHKYNSYYEEQMRQAEIRCGHKLNLYEEKDIPISQIRTLTDYEQRERCEEINKEELSDIEYNAD